jgi:hypothetical protein
MTEVLTSQVLTSLFEVRVRSRCADVFKTLDGLVRLFDASSSDDCSHSSRSSCVSQSDKEREKEGEQQRGRESEGGEKLSELHDAWTRASNDSIDVCVSIEPTPFQIAEQFMQDDALWQEWQHVRSCCQSCV